MDKVLYFRSSPQPLILDEEQREVRRKGNSMSFFPYRCNPSSSLARIESLKKGNGIMIVRSPTLPGLTPVSNRSSHGGNRSELSKTSIDIYPMMNFVLFEII